MRCMCQDHVCPVDHTILQGNERKKIGESRLHAAFRISLWNIMSSYPINLDLRTRYSLALRGVPAAASLPILPRLALLNSDVETTRRILASTTSSLFRCWGGMFFRSWEWWKFCLVCCFETNSKESMRLSWNGKEWIKSFDNKWQPRNCNPILYILWRWVVAVHKKLRHVGCRSSFGCARKSESYVARKLPVIDVMMQIVTRTTVGRVHHRGSRSSLRVGSSKMIGLPSELIGRVNKESKTSHAWTAFLILLTFCQSLLLENHATFRSLPD